MAKQQRSIKQTNIKSQSGDGQQMEQTEVFEDNLLPDAAEIEKLHCIDPTILPWLKQRAEKEQAFRHEAYDKRLKLVKNADQGERGLNYMGMIFAFLILMGGLVFSYFLIDKGNVVTGTIFSGTTILIGASFFIRSKLPAKNGQSGNKQTK